jgi:hypothetical protein
MSTQAIFENCWRYILSTSGYDDFFLATSDVKEAVII